MSRKSLAKSEISAHGQAWSASASGSTIARDTHVVITTPAFAFPPCTVVEQEQIIPVSTKLVWRTVGVVLTHYATPAVTHYACKILA